MLFKNNWDYNPIKIIFTAQLNVFILDVTRRFPLALMNLPFNME